MITQGNITLITFTEGVAKDTPFQVVATDMAYNIIYESHGFMKWMRYPLLSIKLSKSHPNGESSKSREITDQPGR